MIIYILTSVVEADFQSDIVRANLKVGGRMTPRERQIQKGKRDALQIPFLENEQQIVVTSPSSLSIMSFTTKNKRYDVKLDEKGYLSSCSCDDWKTSRLPCKHIWLANRFENIPVADDLDQGYEASVLLPETRVENLELDQPEVDNLNGEISQRVRRVVRNWEIVKREGLSKSIRENIKGKLDNILTEIDKLDTRRSFISQQ